MDVRTRFFLLSCALVTQMHDPEVSLEIKLEVDPKAGTVSIFDSGVGMTREEAVHNLGTIAKSGSAEFLAQVASAEQNSRNSIIGQVRFTQKKFS